MTGKPMSITFRPDATPSAVHSPIPVPHHWKKAVKEALDRDVDLGIIEPVPQGTPTVWCSRMVVTPKKDGTPRRTVDLQKLNKATLRETHHTPSPFNQVSTVPPHMKKTVLDAWNGYHSLPLSPEARDATTFITEWGRYRYLRAPMGFQASGDAYTRRFDDITVDMQRKTRIIDDTILWDSTLASSFWHTLEYISHCAQNGIIFNPTKFVFGEDQVDFGGFTITDDGVKPTNAIIDAIANFPTPTDITGVRSWFGLVNQVAYTFAQADIMAPFRELLSTKNRQLPPTEVPTPSVTLPLYNVTPPAPNQGMPELVQQTAVPTTPPPLLDLPQSPSAAAPEPTTLPPAPTEGLRRSNRAPKPR